MGGPTLRCMRAEILRSTPARRPPMTGARIRYAIPEIMLMTISDMESTSEYYRKLN